MTIEETLQVLVAYLPDHFSYSILGIHYLGFIAHSCLIISDISYWLGGRSLLCSLDFDYIPGLYAEKQK